MEMLACASSPVRRLGPSLWYGNRVMCKRAGMSPEQTA